MRPIRDPEGAEISHLLSACSLEAKSILEIGCGDGKFTRQYAGLSRWVAGIDPDISDMQAGKKESGFPAQKINYIQSVGEKLPFAAHSFETVLFASSL